MVWYGMVWYGMVWYGMVWYGMVILGKSCLVLGSFSLLDFPLAAYGMDGKTFKYLNALWAVLASLRQLLAA